jgi:L,D-peptidoglycan transpeptidase YkuD (ErfK/YbiS/YcfS/YnhG family)
LSQALLRPLSRSTGLLRVGGRDLRCIFGEGGISAAKQEGDGATPCGLLRLRRVLYRADRLPPPDCGNLPREPIAPDDGWCDDPEHSDYNRAVRLPHPGRHERLWRDDPVYDLVAVLGYNDDPVQKGRGSAIFLHVARADERPTQGCVALHLEDLRWALATSLTAIEVPCP